MKSNYLFILLFVSSNIVVAQNLTTSTAKLCAPSDCKKSPIPRGCERYCNSFTTIIDKAVESELRLIAGLDSATIVRILEYRESNEGAVAFEFPTELTEVEKLTFDENISTLNETQINYFNLDEGDRKKVIKQMEKMQL